VRHRGAGDAFCVRATHKPVQNQRATTDARTLAALSAELNIRAAERPPNGDGRERTTHRPAAASPDGHRPGDVPPSPDPSRVVSKLPTCYPTPHQEGSTASHPVRSRPALVSVGAPGGAARTTSRDPPGASTGDPVVAGRAHLTDPARPGHPMRTAPIVTGRPGQAQPDVWPATERTSGPVQRGRRAPLDGSVSRPPATHPTSEAAHG
jgi:hypothetical protein